MNWTLKTIKVACALYLYSAVHEVACKPIFVFNGIFLDVGACYWCMLYIKMINKDY